MLAIALSLSCIAIDGDTLRCGAEHVRLIGIDAPELPGHCRRGRHCAPGDPWASRRALQAALGAGAVTIDRRGRDRYGRTLAIVFAGPLNLSCEQLRLGRAIYVARWDSGGMVGRCGRS